MTDHDAKHTAAMRIVVAAKRLARARRELAEAERILSREAERYDKCVQREQRKQTVGA